MVSRKQQRDVITPYSALTPVRIARGTEQVVSKLIQCCPPEKIRQIRGNLFMVLVQPYTLRLVNGMDRDGRGLLTALKDDHEPRAIGVSLGSPYPSRISESDLYGVRVGLKGDGTHLLGAEADLINESLRAMGRKPMAGPPSIEIARGLDNDQAAELSQIVTYVLPQEVVLEIPELETVSEL
jgi:hypothetical protein